MRGVSEREEAREEIEGERVGRVKDVLTEERREKISRKESETCHGTKAVFKCGIFFKIMRCRMSFRKENMR